MGQPSRLHDWISVTRKWNEYISLFISASAVEDCKCMYIHVPRGAQWLVLHPLAPLKPSFLVRALVLSQKCAHRTNESSDEGSTKELSKRDNHYSFPHVFFKSTPPKGDLRVCDARPLGEKSLGGKKKKRRRNGEGDANAKGPRRKKWLSPVETVGETESTSGEGTYLN